MNPIELNFSLLGGTNRYNAMTGKHILWAVLISYPYQILTHLASWIQELCLGDVTLYLLSLEASAIRVMSFPLLREISMTGMNTM
jgi:hypothetical protein